MSEGWRCIIGGAVRSSDSVANDLERLIFDPQTLALTNLAVRPHKHIAQLVPVRLIQSAAEDIELSCTQDELLALAAASDNQLEQGVVAEPKGYYTGAGPGTNEHVASLQRPHWVEQPRLPTGMNHICSGDHVVATDGNIGQIAGLLADPSSHRITHLLLDDRHLLGHRRFAVPTGAISDPSSEIRLNITKDQVRDLPPVGRHAVPD